MYSPLLLLSVALASQLASPFDPAPADAQAEVTDGYYAESSWEFGVPGGPRASRTPVNAKYAGGLSLDDGNLHASGQGAGSALNACCAGAECADNVCLGGLISRSIRNTVYCGAVGGIVGCFGGLVLGLVPFFAISALGTVLAVELGGAAVIALLSFGAVGCLAGAGAGAPLGFYAAVLFPWWFAPDIAPVDNSPPPPRPGVRRRQRATNKASDDEPSVTHRPEQPRSRADRAPRADRQNRDDDDDGDTARRNRRTNRGSDRGSGRADADRDD